MSELPTPLSAQGRHEQFTIEHYKKCPPADIADLRSGHSDAAHMCDAIAADIRREHTIERGWKAGQVSDLGDAMAAAVKRAGDAIWRMRERVK